MCSSSLVSNICFTEQSTDSLINANSWGSLLHKRDAFWCKINWVRHASFRLQFKVMSQVAPSQNDFFFNEEQATHSTKRFRRATVTAAT